MATGGRQRLTAALLVVALATLVRGATSRPDVEVRKGIHGVLVIDSASWNKHFPSAKACTPVQATLPSTSLDGLLHRLSEAAPGAVHLIVLHSGTRCGTLLAQLTPVVARGGGIAQALSVNVSDAAALQTLAGALQAEPGALLPRAPSSPECKLAAWLTPFDGATRARFGSDWRLVPRPQGRQCGWRERAGGG